MKAAGFSSVIVDTVVHEREAPSVSAFWASFQRTNPPLMLLREKLGADQWKKLEPVIFSKLQQELGTGAISSRARAHLGIGVC